MASSSVPQAAQTFRVASSNSFTKKKSVDRKKKKDVVGSGKKTFDRTASASSLFPLVSAWLRNPQHLLNYVCVHARSDEALPNSASKDRFFNIVSKRYRKVITTRNTNMVQLLKRQLLNMRHSVEKKDVISASSKLIVDWLANVYSCFHVQVLLAILTSMRTSPELWYQRSSEQTPTDKTVSRLLVISKDLKPSSRIENVHRLVKQCDLITYPAWWWYSLRMDKFMRRLTKHYFYSRHRGLEGDGQKQQALFLRSLLNRLTSYLSDEVAKN